jgi:branched-chain amino acid transport system ATP-binding protein
MADPNPPPLLQVRGLTKRFGGVVASDNLDLDIMPGELHALIGPNGAGKTTTIAQLAGELFQSAGTIHFDRTEISALSTPERVQAGLARTFQITQILPDFTAADSVALAVQIRQGRYHRLWKDARRDSELREPALRWLDEVGLAGRATALVGDLAYGEQRQLEIAMALATQPRLLMLDEPLAGMGALESRGMVDLMRRLKGHLTILLVEHDVEVVFALADRVSVLVYGRCIASGSADQIRLNAEVRAAYLGEEQV